MSLSDLISGSGLTVVIFLSLIQISKIEINPWTWIFKFIGKIITADIEERMDRDAAMQCRYRILRFDDEIRHEVLHSREHFNQMLNDINQYEKYCNDHKDTFPNHEATSAIANILSTYNKCRDKNSFI